jgi:hypothetical protein
MTDKTLGDILGETLFADTPFKSVREERTYSYAEEGGLFFLPSIIERYAAFGSATVLGRGKDLDYLLWASDTGEAIKYLLMNGWQYTGTEKHYCAVHTDIAFTTFRDVNNIYNLVLTEDYTDFKRMMKANDLCVKLQLKNKVDRIAVFDAITRKCAYRGV